MYLYLKLIDASAIYLVDCQFLSAILCSITSLRIGSFVSQDRIKRKTVAMCMMFHIVRSGKTLVTPYDHLKKDRFSLQFKQIHIAVVGWKS